MYRSTLALLLAVPLLLAALPHTRSPAAQHRLADDQADDRGHVVTAEVAATDETRQIGLMHRFSLPPDHGMLFVHDAARPLSFWMRNTYIRCRSHSSTRTGASSTSRTWRRRSSGSRGRRPGGLRAGDEEGLVRPEGIGPVPRSRDCHRR